MTQFTRKNTASHNAARQQVSSAAKTSVMNFMNGTSYKMDALLTLRMVAASSIFGEPSYYRKAKVSNTSHSVASVFDKYSIFDNKTASTTDIFIESVNNALFEDFSGTLDLAVEIRTTYNMRLNPALILVLASIHPARVAFNEANPGVFRNALRNTVLRPDDLTNQFDLFIHLNGSKNGLPNVLKREWASLLGGFNAYQISKYKSKLLIDLVRVAHAKGELITELVKTGTVKTTDEEKTWETLRSGGMKWYEIVQTTYVPHMALLRNLRNIFEEKSFSMKEQDELLTRLKAGVEKGKQFPFRYYTAYQIIKDNTNLDTNTRCKVLNALEECMDLAIENFPKLTGTTISLCDNSGSAWGGVTSEYGTTVVADIANLSGIVTALQSDKGEVGVFGDKLHVQKVNTRTGILAQLDKLNVTGKQQGQSTENGIWLFWENAIKNRVHYDNVFIYSDMQAGRGGLYGISTNQYAQYAHNGRYIDVLALVVEYRRVVNAKVNIFSVQVIGYDNNILPDYLYRGAVLTGWTGKEVQFAKELITTWDLAEMPNHSRSRVAQAPVPQAVKKDFLKKAPLKN